MNDDDTNELYMSSQASASKIFKHLIPSHILYMTHM